MKKSAIASIGAGILLILATVLFLVLPKPTVVQSEENGPTTAVVEKTTNPTKALTAQCPALADCVQLLQTEQTDPTCPVTGQPVGQGQGRQDCPVNADGNQGTQANQTDRTCPVTGQPVGQGQGRQDCPVKAHNGTGQRAGRNR